ncbi:MAG TPA: hypothetical protein VMU58_10260 [Gaiellaceae bacterium]|nr:hypothetical protein [Gaiellaceae bacterium]
MPRGYMEGPAADEAERLADEAARTKHNHPKARVFPAVFGCTEDDPAPHFLGWRNEVDPDALFASGKAWGVTIRRVAAAPAA